MADELYESFNELLPVASVVHIALGAMALILVHRTKDREWNERFAGLLISWMMVMLGIQYVCSTIIDYRVDQLGNSEVSHFNTYDDIFYSAMSYGQGAMESAFYATIDSTVNLPIPTNREAECYQGVHSSSSFDLVDIGAIRHFHRVLLQMGEGDSNLVWILYLDSSLSEILIRRDALRRKERKSDF